MIQSHLMPKPTDSHISIQPTSSTLRVPPKNCRACHDLMHAQCQPYLLKYTISYSPCNIQTSKNWLCCNHCLGICHHRKLYMFWYWNGYVNGDNLPHNFVMALMAKLNLEIDVMLSSEYQTLGMGQIQQQLAVINNDTGQGNKWQWLSHWIPHGGLINAATGKWVETQACWSRLVAATLGTQVEEANLINKSHHAHIS